MGGLIQILSYLPDHDYAVSMIGDLTEKRMKEILAQLEHGHLACHADGETYCVPIFYVYEGEFLYSHTYDGKKVTMMRKNPRVCVLVHTLKNLWNWESVLVQGGFEECSGEEATHAVDLLSKRLHACKSEYCHLRVVPSPDSHYSRADHCPVILYRLRIHGMTGRFEKQGLKSL